MPFFFGFNFNEKCGVLPSWIDEDHPPKYEPISCGDWCKLTSVLGAYTDRTGALYKKDGPPALGPSRCCYFPVFPRHVLMYMQVN